MARTTDVWKFLLLGTLAHVSLAQAQQAQQPPSSAPPKMERVEEGSDVPLTNTTPAERRGQKVAEKRVDGGRTTEVQVSTGKSTYTMKANPPDTVSQPGDTTSGGLRPPQWKVMEFDLFKKKQGATAEATGTAAAPPPPAPAK